MCVRSGWQKSKTLWICCARATKNAHSNAPPHAQPNALFFKHATKAGNEGGSLVHHLGRSQRLWGFSQQVDVTAALAVVHARTEQKYGRAGCKHIVRGLRDGVAFPRRCIADGGGGVSSILKQLGRLRPHYLDESDIA